MSPSYRIVFYVSGHGFGHTSRSIEVIHAVLRARPDAHVVVKTSAPLRLFTRTLRLRSGQALEGRCELIEFECDAGMAQIDSLNIDVEASLQHAITFQQKLPALAASEAAYLGESGAHVVVGDIPPLAFAAAHEAHLPSIAIGNFTWDWIYHAYDDPRAQDLARDIRSVYQHATTVLRLPMAGGFESLESSVRDIPFIARHSQRTQDEVREALGLPPRDRGKPLVLMSFGGYGVAGMHTVALAALNEYTIATTDVHTQDNAIKPAPGILYISEQRVYGSGLRYEDLVRGADVVVTKPGYGIISEAIANGAAMIYTSRGHFAEYDVLVKEMPRYLRAQFIEQADLLSGNWQQSLETVLSLPAPPEKPATNGADIAAAEILDFRV